VSAPHPNSSAKPQRDIVVIGASAGGADALAALLQQLPADIPASLFVVIHTLPEGRDHLIDLLNTVGPLLAKHAETGEEIRHGIVYVAPPDRHLLVKPGHVRVTRGPRENRWRPAIDPLFRSAAVAYGSRVIGIVLTGLLDDGTAGLLAIKRCGGVALVQHPDDAAYPQMPETALANVPVDHKLALADMGAAIVRLTQESAEPAGAVPQDIVVEARIAETGYSDDAITERLGTLSVLSCPECGGPLWERESGNLNGFRCRVGHAYGAESLLSAQDEALEASIWAAVRLFEQRAHVLTSMAAKDRTAKRPRMQAHHEALALEARTHATALRNVLVKRREES
jgi:two-component system, chemotaxis family, protein-glutamate methylesterase/glutaminase